MSAGYATLTSVRSCVLAADPLVLGVAEQALDAGVPAEGVPVEALRVDDEVADVLDDQAEQLSALL
jgi:hypothetical protein